MIKKLPALLLLFCFHGLFSQRIFKDYVDGQVYVKFSGAALKTILRENPDNISPAALGALNTCLNRYGVTRISRPFHQASDDALLPYVLKFQFTQTSAVSAFINELTKTAGIDYAEKVPLMRTDALPNDPVFPAHLTQINASSAWNVFNGSSNIIVAIVDDAVMWNHADLSANISINAGEIAGNNIDDDNNGYVDDVHGYDVTDLDNNPAPTNTLMSHGTHCAGIAGARTNNGLGIASIGWNIKILPVKCQTDNGSVSLVANGFEGIIYAVRAKARIISCSWGGAGFALTSEAAINYAWARGALVIAAAGNASTNTPNYPGAYNHVYCVASVDGSNVKSGFSNYGSWVDISAPGENINSTVPYSGATPSYQQMSGTSMATPLVAGLAGLMLSKSPQMTPNDVTNCLSSTAVNIYSISANSAYAGQLGAGRIEAFQAMNCAAAFATHPPVASFSATPRNTCPNTPVHFSDSSLYLPTSWNWTFQGGTPATSTLSNPVVQWTTPGTYSAALTVSNINGSDAISRVSYITVASPVALPFSEGFQSSQFLPPGWTSNNLGNDIMYWQRKTGVGAFGTSTACAMFDNFTYNVAGDRDEMRSPKYNLSTAVASHLRFDVAYARYDALDSDTLEVRLSTNCGVSWSTIYLKGGTALATAPDAVNQFTPSSSQWRTDSVDVSSVTAGQGSVMFSFVNHGGYGQPIYIDNINLAFPNPLSNVQVPAGSCAGSAVTFTNLTTGASGYVWDVPGATTPTSGAVSPTFTFNAAGLYDINLYSTNGTQVDTLHTVIPVYDFPTLTFNTTDATCLTCSDGSLQTQMTGGTGPFSFTWSPSGGNAATAAGLTPGCYTVTINGQGCVSTSTACVGYGTTGIASLAADPEALLVYPNPATNTVTIEFNRSFGCSLFSSAGQLVFENKTGSNTIRINLDKFAKGIYLLEIKSAEGTAHKKIIISE